MEFQMLMFRSFKADSALAVLCPAVAVFAMDAYERIGALCFHSLNRRYRFKETIIALDPERGGFKNGLVTVRGCEGYGIGQPG
jgi:hypothetical protein